MLDRSLAGVKRAYRQCGGQVMGIRFPLGAGPWSEQQRQVFDALKQHEAALVGFGRAKSPPSSNDVHTHLAMELTPDLGWRVEVPGGAKISVQRGLGFNEIPIPGTPIELDGWHEESGTLIEVERGGAVQAGAVLKRILGRGDLGQIRHFIAIVPWHYTKVNGEVYDYTFHSVIAPEYERAALANYETYTVFCVGGAVSSTTSPEGPDKDMDTDTPPSFN